MMKVLYSIGVVVLLVGAACAETCGEARERLQRNQGKLVGQFVPQCDSEGNYTPIQCSASTGFCYCANVKTGEKMSEQFRPWETSKNCAAIVGTLSVPKTCATVRESLTHGPQRIGQYIPQCSEDGNYNSMQCSGSTGYCWCVDEQTGVKKSTAFRPWETKTHCGSGMQNLLDESEDEEAASQGSCHAQELNTQGLVGRYTPQCDANGNYKIRQCWGSTGYCWCVNPSSNEKLTTPFRPWLNRQINCTEVYQNQQTHGKCRQQRNQILSQTHQTDTYVPQCDTMGDYLPTQCDPKV